MGLNLKKGSKGKKGEEKKEKKVPAQLDPEIRKVKLSDMNPATYNPRKMGADAREGLGHSIERFGMVQHIVWNEQTSNVVGGHQRYDFLEQHGIEEIHVVVVDLDGHDEKVLNVTLNNPHIQGEFDLDKLAVLMKEIEKREKSVFDKLGFKELSGDLPISFGGIGGIGGLEMPDGFEVGDDKVVIGETIREHISFYFDKTTTYEKVKGYFLLRGTSMQMNTKKLLKLIKHAKKHGFEYDDEKDNRHKASRKKATGCKKKGQ